MRWFPPPVRTVIVALLLVAGPGCSGGETPPQPEQATPASPEEIERAVRRKLGIPDEAERVAVFGMTSHWDINWLKTFDDYFTGSVARIIARALALLDEDPAYTYAISEVDFLRKYWEDRPEERERILRHVSSGRLRIVGGGITSPDTLLPPGELLVRDWLLGNRWTLDTLGVKPSAAWQPDSFGHAPSLPAILDALGYRSVAFARLDGGPSHVPRTHPSPPPVPGTTAESLETAGVSSFFWAADDGSRVLAHWMYDGYAVADAIDLEPPELATVIVWLLGFLGIDPESTPFWQPNEETALERMARALDQAEAVRNTPYVFVPIGIDFAYPKSRLTEYISAWNAKRYPSSGIYSVPAPFEDFIRMVEGRHASLPVHPFDMSPLWMGFYTTKPALKFHHRRAMENLLAAEKLAVLARGMGQAYPHAELAQAWNTAVRCNHHDGVTGTAADDVYRTEQLPEIRGAEEAAARIEEDLLARIAERVDTSDLPATGSALVVFNPLSWERSDWVEVRRVLPGRGVHSLRVREPGGEEVPAQLLASRLRPDGSLEEATVGFVAQGVPPVGWKTYFLCEDSLPYPAYDTGLALRESGTRLEMENRYYTLRLDLDRGACMDSLVERATGREFLQGPGNDVVVWRDMGGLYRLGHEIHAGGLEEIFRTRDEPDVRYQILERGPVRLRVRVETAWTHPIVREVALVHGLQRVEASATLQAPLQTAFTVRFPTSMQSGLLTMAVPYGEAARPVHKAYDPTFWPGIEWVDLPDAARASGFSVMAVGSRGWRHTPDGVLDAMLHRNALIELPDILGPPGTDFAQHTIPYALYPSSGGSWLHRRAWAQARSMNVPLRVVETGIHGGTLPGRLSTVSLDDPRAEIVAFKAAEDGGEGLLLRIFRRGADPFTVRMDIGLPGRWTVLESDASEVENGRVLGASPRVEVFLNRRVTTLKLLP